MPEEGTMEIPSNAIPEASGQKNEEKDRCVHLTILANLQGANLGEGPLRNLNSCVFQFSIGKK